MQARVAALFADLPITVEAKNQARVHLWYERWFGYPYAATAIGPPWHRTLSRALHLRGVAVCGCNLAPRNLSLYAPYGLEELYAGLLQSQPGVSASAAVPGPRQKATASAGRG